MANVERICLESIGFVRTKAIGREVRDRTGVSEIILHEDLAEALEGIESFSHLFVIFWMHEISDEERMTKKIHPRGRMDMPLVGIYATRTPHRRNPIGLTLVELLKVRGNILTVRGLDAFNGTPILDIKPFDRWDIAEPVRLPEWRDRLDGEEDSKRQ
jgi:tRNA-Thr(GGU) m(6)t(6)A37 methyltransferase TsaA